MQVLRLAAELMLRERRAQQFGCFAQDDNLLQGWVPQPG